MMKNLVINGKVKYCTECKRDMKFIPAVTYIREFRLYLCHKHFNQWFEEWVEKTIQQFNMFSREDKVLVALSGGKDSMVLWYVLNKLGYQADGFHINLGIPGNSGPSAEAIAQLAQKLNKQPIIVDLHKETGAGIPEIARMFRSPACSICGRIKRYYFNRTARLGGYKIVATGHNLDDEAAALLSNLLHWKEKFLVSKYPVLKEDSHLGLPRKVKPLTIMTEEQIRLYAEINEIPFTSAICPLSSGARLKEFKEFISRIEERSPGTRRSFYLNYIRKYQKLFISRHEKKTHRQNLQKCKICGEPSPSEVCLVCKIKSEIEKSRS